MPESSSAPDARQRAALLEAVFETAIDAIITIDERGTMRFVNPATERLFGYSPSEVIGKNISTLMPAHYAAEHDQYLRNYLRTLQRNVIGIGREVAGRRKDGTTFPMHLAVSEVMVDGQRLFTGIVRDISDLSKAQSRAAGVGRIVEDSVNEIYVFDADTLRFIEVNRGARENLGYTMDELRALTPLDIKPEHTRETFTQLIQPLVTRATKKIQFETAHQRKDGTRYDAEVHLQLAELEGVPCFVAIILDITERLQTESLLRVQQKAIEAASSGIIVTDATQADHPISYCNAAFLEMTGYSLDEVLGRNCRILQRDDRDQPAIEELQTAIEDGRECRVLLRNYRKDGSMFWNDLRVSPISDRAGRIINFVGIQTDVTRRKLDEEELERRVRKRTRQLRRAQAQLVQREKMAMLGEVSGGIAHEIRNPLNAIRTSAYYLLHARNPDETKQRQHLERIERQVTLADNVVTALSNFAKLPVPCCRPTSVKQLLAGVLSTMTIPENIDVTIDVPEDISEILGDDSQISIVFRNLLRNAREAMPDGGSVSVTATQVGGDVRVAVSDTGIGMTPEILSRILEPLFTTKSRGMGLGLAISRAIVEQHHGKLDMVSQPGQGSTFAVTLPGSEPQHKDRR